jgi:hypothetical protein
MTKRGLLYVALTPVALLVGVPVAVVIGGVATVAAYVKFVAAFVKAVANVALARSVAVKTEQPVRHMCPVCGKPSAQNECQACEFRRRIAARERMN